MLLQYSIIEKMVSKDLSRSKLTWRSRLIGNFRFALFNLQSICHFTYRKSKIAYHSFSKLPGHSGPTPCSPPYPWQKKPEQGVETYQAKPGIDNRQKIANLKSDI